MPPASTHTHREKLTESTHSDHRHIYVTYDTHSFPSDKLTESAVSIWLNVKAQPLVGLYSRQRLSPYMVGVGEGPRRGESEGWNGEG